MITQLTGTIIDRISNLVTLDVQGVGYGVTVTDRTLARISEGEKTTFYIAENIKEDHFELYGFLDRAEREMYVRLNAVTGVGPKATMAILSAHSVRDIEQAIATANTTVFSNVSGIGKKTASRIILELKGKLEVGRTVGVKDDPAYMALVALGYSARDAEQAVLTIPTDVEGVDARVKAALRGVAQ